MLRTGKKKRGIKTDARAGALQLAVGLCAVLWTRCSLFGTAWPYGAALLCACTVCGAERSALLAGILLGQLSLLPASLPDLIGVLAVGCVLFLLRSMHCTLTPLRASAVMGVQLLLLPFCEASPYGFIIGALEISAAAVMVSVLCRLLPMLIGREKRLITEEQALWLLLCLCVLLIGTATLDLPFFSLGICFACVITGIFGSLGSMGAGAAAGIACGLALCAAGGRPVLAGTLGAAGILFGAFRTYKRPLAMLCVLLANTAAYLFPVAAALPFAELSAAAAVMLLLPGGVWSYWGKFADAAMYKQHLTQNSLRTAQLGLLRRLSACADAMELSAQALVPAGAQEQQELRDFAQTVAGTVCIDCVHKSKCWGSEFVHTYAAFQAMAGICCGQAAEEPYGLYERCIHRAEVIRAMKDLCGEESEILRLRCALWESRSFAARQLQQLSGLLREIPGNAAGYGMHAVLEQRITEAFLQEGVRLLQTDVEAQENLRIGITLKEPVPFSAELLSRVCGCPMELVQTRRGKKTWRLLFAQKLLLDVFSAVQQQSAEASGVCGDSYAFVQLSPQRQAFLLSDGMGIGRQANKESSMTLQLTECLLRAGCEEAFVLDAVNRLMLLCGEETYATLDLCIVDTARRLLHLSKIGSAPSYILYNGSVEKLAGPALPIGILETVAPFCCERRLYGGEYIFLLSDGIADCAGEEMEDWLRQLRGRDAGSMAKELLARAAEKGIRDDATVTVLCVEPRCGVSADAAELAVCANS